MRRETATAEECAAALRELSDADLRRLDAAAFIREMPVVALDVVPGLAAEEKPELAEVVRAASERKAAEFGRSVLEDSIARGAEMAAAAEALTIKELAQVASTLVSLSSFQQQMSLGRQTVGGPVDVAVISKGDSSSGSTGRAISARRSTTTSFRTTMAAEEQGRAAGHRRTNKGGTRWWIGRGQRRWLGEWNAVWNRVPGRRSKSWWKGRHASRGWRSRSQGVGRRCRMSRGRSSTTSPQKSGREPKVARTRGKDAVGRMSICGSMSLGRVLSLA